MTSNKLYQVIQIAAITTVAFNSIRNKVAGRVKNMYDGFVNLVTPSYNFSINDFNSMPRVNKMKGKEFGIEEKIKEFDINSNVNYDFSKADEQASRYGPN